MKNRSSVVSVMSKAIVGAALDLNSALSIVYDTLQASKHIRISDMNVSVTAAFLLCLDQNC